MCYYLLFSHKVPDKVELCVVTSQSRYSGNAFREAYTNRYIKVEARTNKIQRGARGYALNAEPVRPYNKI